MSTIDDILHSSLHHKEKSLKIANTIKENPQTITDLFTSFNQATDPQKGTITDAIEDISTTHPDLLLPYLDTLIAHITYKATHVTWGVQEAIGNIAKTHPQEAARALPTLLKNTTHASTVVRWCAAYAITQITLHDTTHQPDHIKTITRLAKKETNNGVLNLYRKTLKTLDHPLP
jgi:hypothetical protein